MQTVLTTSPIEAAQIIKRGGVAAFPTETVYGLGANVFDEAAIKKIFAAKGRPTDNPLIAHIADVSQISLLASHITESARQFIEAFFPGSLTIVLPKSESVPTIATAGLQTVGVRMPRHELANDFLKACGVPLVAPSANLSGRPSPTTWQAVYEDLNGKIDCILKGEQTEIGLESTVVDCTGVVPLVLRAGAVTLEQLQTVVPQTRLANTKEDEPARSPGLKHKHYSPRARVVLINEVKEAEANKENAYIGLDKPDIEFGLQQVCSSVEEYAHILFLFFRQCDEREIKTIFCQKVEAKNLGLALMDRLKRSADYSSV
jgi:L-threonylcarbamoyladenylate synthase